MPPSQGQKGSTVATPKARSVLIAVEPPSFIRLIEHLLHGHKGLRVVGCPCESSALALAGRLAPDVIIANTRRHGRERGDVLADLRRSSPASTLILLTHAPGEPFQGPDAADACLPEDAVVRRLLPVIRRLRQRRAASHPPSLREQRRSCRS